MRLELLKQLQRDEGFSSKPYKDTRGVLTVGYGRNLEDVGVSESEAYAMLDNDCTASLHAVMKAWPWAYGLDEARLGVLGNMCFEMGVTKLRSFTTFLELMEQKRFADAAHDLEGTDWYHEVPTRARRLQQQLITGQWQ